MKTKFKGILTLLLAFVVQFTFAQERVISGVVSDEMGPVADISVVVKGTTKGTVTDFDGKYSIKAKKGDALVFSHVSYGTIEKVVGDSNVINVVVSETGETLDAVIVTAMGVKKEKKALGYSVSEVKSDQVESKAVGDVARILSGKASGVQITDQSGTSGSATSVVVRGYSSINGSNQALFIVDGVPFSNDNNAIGNVLEGNAGSSRFLDLDPNNIESITVLKGLAAATLYGSEGKNGVILITTKTGSSKSIANKSEVSVSQSYFINKIASLPDYQSSYGGGFNQSFGWYYSNWGPSFNADGVDGYLNDPAGLIDANGTLEHPYSSSSFLNNLNGGNNVLHNEFAGQRYDYKPYNSVENFFRTGHVSTTSVSFKSGSEDGKIGYSANFGVLDDVGFTPGNDLKRVNASIGGRAKLNNNFTIKATINYAQTKYKTPPVAASFGNGNYFSVFGNVFFTPRNVDLMGLPYTIPETGGSIYYRNGNDILNPRWTVENAGTKQLTNRFYGQTTLDYEINDNISLTYRVGIDFYNERVNSYSNKNGVNYDAAIYGYLDSYDNNNTIWDHFLASNFKYELSDKVNMTAIAGVTSRSEDFYRHGVSSTGQIVFGVLRQYNFQDSQPIQVSQKRNIAGAFAEFGFDYDNYAYLTVSARKDWVSNLPTANNSQFYPSVSGSFIATQAVEGLKSESGKGLNYLKLRIGLGQSAGFPTGYPTVNTVVQNTNTGGGAAGSIITNTVSDFLANPDLKPELVSEIEYGMESRFFDNRITLDLSYFSRSTTDLIVTKPLAPSTGYTATQTNIGKIEGDGWEADLGLDIFKSDKQAGFNWNSSVNFSTSEMIVTEQQDDIITYAGVGGIANNAAIEGYPLGVLVGDRILRDADGNLVVGSDGFYRSENQVTLDDGRTITPIIGDPNPDYVMNFSNTLSYKNFSLGFLINHTKGGDMYSSTVATLQGRGLIVDDRVNTYVLPGVLDNGQPNNIQINNSDFYFNNILFGPSELQVYDASVVRLQEVSLGYNLPKKMLEKTPFGSFSITFSGNNLWYDAYNTPDRANFDPNVAGSGVGNSRGFDFMNGPSSKRYGMSVKLSF